MYKSSGFLLGDSISWALYYILVPPCWESFPDQTQKPSVELLKYIEGKNKDSGRHEITTHVFCPFTHSNNRSPPH